MVLGGGPSPFVAWHAIDQVTNKIIMRSMEGLSDWLPCPCSSDTKTLIGLLKSIGQEGSRFYPWWMGPFQHFFSEQWVLITVNKSWSILFVHHPNIQLTGLRHKQWTHWLRGIFFPPLSSAWPEWCFTLHIQLVMVLSIFFKLYLLKTCRHPHDKGIIESFHPSVSRLTLPSTLQHLSHPHTGLYTGGRA